MNRLSSLIILLVFALPCSARTIKIGHVTDIHQADKAVVSGRYYIQAEDKLAGAMADFNTADVNLILDTGDFIDDPYYIDHRQADPMYDGNHGLTDILAVINDSNYSNLSDVNRQFCIGNHDFGNSEISGTYTKSDYLAGVGQSAAHWYIDIGNIRIVGIDTNFNSSGADASIHTGYSFPEHTWLETTLQEADDAGKFSIVCSHHPVIFLAHYSSNQYIADTDELLALLARHKVILTLHGHRHLSLGRTSVELNADNNRIYSKIGEAMVDGNYAADSNFAAHTIVYINDQTGKFYIKGYGSNPLTENGLNHFEDGMDEFRWIGESGEANPDSWAEAYNWQRFNPITNAWEAASTYPLNNSIITLEDEPTDTLNSCDGDREMFIAQLTIKSDYTAGVQAEAYLWFYDLETLIIEGGFGNNMSLRSRYGFGYIKSTGVSGTGDKTIDLRCGYTSGYDDRHVGQMDVNHGDPNYIIRVHQGTKYDSTVDELNLWSGKVDVNDLQGADCVVGLHGVDSNESILTLNQYGGVLNLSRSAADGQVDILNANIHGGTFDLTTGSNAANGKRISTLRILGGTLNLNIDNLSIVNDIELFATPTSYTNKTDQSFPVVVKGYGSCELTQIMTGDNFVTKGDVRKRPSPRRF